MVQCIRRKEARHDPIPNRKIDDARRIRSDDRLCRDSVSLSLCRSASAGHGIRLSRLAGLRRQSCRRRCDREPLLRAPGDAAAAGNQRSPQLQYGSDQIHLRHGDVLGHRRLHGRAPDRLPARLARAEFRPAVDQLRPAAATAHVGGDLRVWRQCPARHLVLCGSEDLPRAAGRRPRAVVRRRRLQFLHPDRRHRLSARRHPGQGIRRARMVFRLVADDRLGDLSAGLPGDDLQAQGTPHLRRQLVLSRLHRHHRGAASRQQSRGAGVGVRLEILYRLGRRSGCDVPVVVRPQRGRILPHRRLPRHHVLLHSEAGGAADLFLPAVDHPLLGADLPLHLGRARIICTTRRCRTGRRRSA